MASVNFQPTQLKPDISLLIRAWRIATFLPRVMLRVFLYVCGNNDPEHDGEMSATVHLVVIDRHVSCDSGFDSKKMIQKQGDDEMMMKAKVNVHAASKRALQVGGAFLEVVIKRRLAIRRVLNRVGFNRLAVTAWLVWITVIVGCFTCFAGAYVLVKVSLFIMDLIKTMMNRRLSLSD